MKYFDTHAHYNDERFSLEYEGGADVLLDKVFSENVGYIINVGTSPETSREVIAQAKKYPTMYTILGIHPSDCQRLTMTLNEAIRDIKALIKNPENKCVGIGEIGLDYHYPDTDKEKQMAYFEAQMCLAEELSLPVSIHDRDAHGDVLEVIKKHPAVRGVLHSFSGSREMALELVKLGYMISFSGVLTFKNARKTVETALAVPRENILIETDCPYLAPTPHRGELNHSGNLVYTNRTLAQILSVSEEECAALTEANAKRFFGIN